MRYTRTTALVTIVIVLVIAALLGGTIEHRHHLRSLAEAGLSDEIRENGDGVQQMRDSIPKEIENISAVSELLMEREAGRPVPDGTTAKIGLSVMAFTNANWQSATTTGAIELMNYESVQRFAAAYFEQSRLAQLQTSTLETMMGLSSYVGHGERVASMTPEQARLAEVQAQLLIAHLRMMLRMSDGLQDAYKDALAR